MSFKSLQIGKYTIQKPIVQGGMGVGISWDQLAGTVSKEGGLGVVSSVGTGYFDNKKYSTKLVAERPLDVMNFYSPTGFKAIHDSARQICGDKPLAANILYAINDYGRVVKDGKKDMTGYLMQLLLRVQKVVDIRAFRMSNVNYLRIN